MKKNIIISVLTIIVFIQLICLINLNNHYSSNCHTIKVFNAKLHLIDDVMNTYRNAAIKATSVNADFTKTEINETLNSAYKIVLKGDSIKNIYVGAIKY